MTSFCKYVWPLRLYLPRPSSPPIRCQWRGAMIPSMRRHLMSASNLSSGTCWHCDLVREVFAVAEVSIRCWGYADHSSTTISFGYWCPCCHFSTHGKSINLKYIYIRNCWTEMLARSQGHIIILVHFRSKR
jgi:hypothetical protein